MDFLLPQMGEGLYEVELIAWRVEAGAKVKRGQSLMEVMSDKATMEVPSPFVGTITDLSAEVGTKIHVGQVVLKYQGSEEPAAVAAPASSATSTSRGMRNPATVGRRLPVPNGLPGTSRAGFPPPAAPSVRQMARKLGIDLGQMVGSGPGGRILVDDLVGAIKKVGPAVGTDKPTPEPHPEFGVPGTRVKYQGMRRRIGEHLVQSKQICPHYTYVDECEVTEMVKVRQSLREPFAKQNIRLTYLPFFVKAAALALKEVPIANSSLDDEHGEIVLHEQRHIGIAVATAAGLVVPVVRDADKKDLVTIAREIERLSTEARGGRPRLEDLKGGTFTVTSVGNIGGLISTPIINHPEVGILGLGKIVRRPMYDAAGNIYPADLIYLSLAFDHRVVDGAVGAAFGNALMRHLSNPCLLLLPEKL